MSNERITIGLDIGGANLKACFADGQCRSVFFPMWKDHARLAEALKDLLGEMDRAEDVDCERVQVAVTLTGELADCFATRSQGVAQILESVLRVFQRQHVHVYSVGGRWLSFEQAVSNPWSVAASNWHALAMWVLQRTSMDELDVIIDIGSTTIDVLPILEGSLLSCGETDRQRLERQTLVYSGMERTPIAMIVPAFSLNGQKIPVMAEVFSTTVDAYLVSGDIAEEPDNLSTADGRPRIRQHALERLARQIGEDADRFSEGELKSIALQVIEAQVGQLLDALTANTQHVPATKPVHVLSSGHGRALMERVIEQLQPVRPVKIHWLEERLGIQSSRAAPALAVAQLLEAAEEDCKAPSALE